MLSLVILMRKLPAVALALIAACCFASACSSDNTNSEYGTGRTADDPSILSTSEYPDIPGPYSFEELGLDKAVDNAQQQDLPLVAHRSSEELAESLLNEFQNRNQTRDDHVPDSQERQLFDFGVMLLLREGAHTRTPEFIELRQEAEALHAQRVLDCARASAPDLDEQSLFLGAPRKDNSAAQARFAEHAKKFGLTTSEFLDLRHECAQRAATTGSEQDQQLAHLLGRIRDLHAAALIAWLERNPEIVGPELIASDR